MIRLRHKLLIRALRVLDQVVLIATAISIIHFFADGSNLMAQLPVLGSGRITDAMGFLFLGVGWIAAYDYYVRYRADRYVTLRTQLKDFLKAATGATVWFLLISALFSIRGMNAGTVALFWGVVLLWGLLSRVSMRLMLMNARRSGFNYRHLVMVGANDRSLEIARKIEESPELGYKLVGFVANSEESAQRWSQREDSRPLLGTVSQLREILESHQVDEMLVCLSLESSFRTVAEILKDARELGIVLRFVPNGEEGNLLRNFNVEEFEDQVVITFFRERLLLQLLVKRAIDLTVALAVLAVLSPLMLLTGLLVKLTSPGPVFFVQDRVGMNQRRFRLYKFRSMVADADQIKRDLAHLNENDGPAFKIQNDPRVTAVGRVIRKYSIDELPQLFNVLKGEMSLVGPRPPLPEEVEKYEWMFRRRLSVKPGITCVWQVNGRSETSFADWMRMDRDYVENWSLWLDFKILLQTVPAVLFGKGAH